MKNYINKKACNNNYYTLKEDFVDDAKRMAADLASKASNLYKRLSATPNSQTQKSNSTNIPPVGQWVNQQNIQQGGSGNAAGGGPYPDSTNRSTTQQPQQQQPQDPSLWTQAKNVATNVASEVGQGVENLWNKYSNIEPKDAAAERDRQNQPQTQQPTANDGYPQENNPEDSTTPPPPPPTGSTQPQNEYKDPRITNDLRRKQIQDEIESLSSANTAKEDYAARIKANDIARMYQQQGYDPRTAEMFANQAYDMEKRRREDMRQTRLQNLNNELNAMDRSQNVQPITNNPYLEPSEPPKDPSEQQTPQPQQNQNQAIYDQVVASDVNSNNGNIQPQQNIEQMFLNGTLDRNSNEYKQLKSKYETEAAKLGVHYNQYFIMKQRQARGQQ